MDSRVCLSLHLLYPAILRPVTSSIPRLLPQDRLRITHTSERASHFFWDGEVIAVVLASMICAVVQFGQHQHLTILGLDGERPVSGFVQSISVKAPRTVGHPTSLRR